MKTNCDIIRDLLPLYAEHITSEATNTLVEKHLAECEACRTELEQMEQPVAVRADPQPDVPLQKIKTTLQKKSIQASIMAMVVVLCTVALVFWMGTLKSPVTAEQAQLWTYNYKENSASLCALEAQGNGVWLEPEDSFSWGSPNITVKAVHYRFPSLHKAFLSLTGSDVTNSSIAVSKTQLLTVVCADETRFYRNGQQVDRYIVQENPDGTFDYVYGTAQEYGRDYEKG